jgi:D-3-phosphoglycerate dehydrogenase / 2-oxoglutarate reductase
MNIYFVDTVHPILWDRLVEHGHQCFDITVEDFDTCCRSIHNAHGIVVRSRFPMNERFLRFAPELKFIARSGAGMENIDEAYTSARGIICYNAPEGNRNAVGEHALGMLLNLFNHLNKGDREIRQGIWDREGNRGIELDGKTVGIIGFGNNGQAFAKKLRGFDVTVLAYDKYKTGFSDTFVKESQLSDIFQMCDIVSFHIPQNTETLYIGDDKFFSSFVKNIFVINLSRGKIIQTSALVKGLNSGKISGACLDVLEYESSSFENIFDGKLPADFSYLLHSEKVILSPHVGGWTIESYFKLSNVLADKILAHYSS